MNYYWGYHLMLDASCCSGISNRDNIYAWLKELIPAIGMQAHGEPMIEYLLPDDPRRGYSVMQMITTSNICAHFCEQDGTGYIDIFSCKHFDVQLACDVTSKYFNPHRMKVNFITRHAE